VAEIADLNINASSNTGRFPEGMSVPAINNGARELEAMIARTDKDRNGSLPTSGSGTAYAIITNASITTLAAGQWFVVRFDEACGTAPTFQVNATAAKPLLRQTGSAIVPGDITANMIALVVYNASVDSYNVIGIGDAAPTIPTYTVANLPSSAPAGSMAYASNGRKNGEGSAAGTGVMAFKDGSAWRAVDTGATVAA
jgi:hypothetical protein